MLPILWDIGRKNLRKNGSTVVWMAMIRRHWVSDSSGENTRGRKAATGMSTALAG
jgi:hypothetical protein